MKLYIEGPESLYLLRKTFQSPARGLDTTKLLVYESIIADKMFIFLGDNTTQVSHNSKLYSSQ